MSVSNYRVFLAFVQLSDGSLGEFTNNVITAMDATTIFPTPPVLLPALRTLRDTYLEKLADMVNGGKQATAAKNQARTAVVTALRQNASYVQSLTGTDLPGLLSSGYQVTSTNRTTGPLVKPVIINVDNFQSTKLMLGVARDPNARAHEVRLRTGSNPFATAGIFTKASRMLLEDLVPGTNHEMQTRAIGGSTGYSDWSDAVSHMAT